MSVVVSVEDTGVCRKDLTIEVPADVVGSETRRVLSSVARQASLPGFRKGKVPASLLRNRYREDIDREVLERLVPRYWEMAREEQGLDPLGQPQLKEVGDLDDDGPLRFVATVEVRPPLDLGGVDRDSLEVPELEVEPSDDEVEAALDELRRQVGDWTAVERPAARGDRVAVHVVEETGDGAAGDDGGGEPDGDDAEAAGDGSGDADPEAAEDDAGDEGQVVRIEVGDPNVWEELSLAVTGLTAGQEGRFTRRPPAPEGDAEAPPPRTFRIRVDEVEERELPPLDDELAAKVGDFETADELRRAMRDKLRHDKGHERDARRREAVLEQLRERHPVPLPQGVLHEETQSLLNDYAQDVARRGVDPRQAGIDWNRLGEQFKPMAERRLHDRLLLDAVAQAREVAVEPGEVEAAIASIARSQGVSVPQVRQALEDRLEGLERQIRREKAMKWLLGEDAAPAEDGEDAGDGAAAAAPAAADDATAEPTAEPSGEPSDEETA